MKLKFNRFMAVSFIVFAVALCGCGKNTDAVKISLPTDEQCSESGIPGILQTDELEDEQDEYVLTDYKLENGSVAYTFTEKKDQKKSLEVIGKKMSQDEYKNSLPVGDLKDVRVNGIDCKFINRTVHYVPNDYEPDDRVKNNVKIGTTEIKYGSDSDIEELLPIQRIYWYDPAIQIGYSLESIGQYYSEEEMSIYVQNYVENSK